MKKANINAIVGIRRLPKPAKTIDVFPRLDFSCVKEVCARIYVVDHFASIVFFMPKN
jgi:hypothetical protein